MSSGMMPPWRGRVSRSPRGPWRVSEEPEGWMMAEEPEDGPNPFGDGEATRQFLELYTGKRCRDSKRWLDCVTSAPFWDAAREARFTHLLL